MNLRDPQVTTPEFLRAWDRAFELAAALGNATRTRPPSEVNDIHLVWKKATPVFSIELSAQMPPWVCEVSYREGEAIGYQSPGHAFVVDWRIGIHIERHTVRVVPEDLQRSLDQVTQEVRKALQAAAATRDYLQDKAF